jgi:hypothetical protein
MYRYAKEGKDQKMEEFIARLLRRKAYLERLEEHPDAPVDQELADGSGPFLRDDSV